MSEVGQTPIHFAAMTGQNHFVQNIIERIGAKVLLFRGNVFIEFSGPSESVDHFYLGQKFSPIIKLKHYYIFKEAP